MGNKIGNSTGVVLLPTVVCSLFFSIISVLATFPFSMYTTGKASLLCLVCVTGWTILYVFIYKQSFYLFKRKKHTDILIAFLLSFYSAFITTYYFKNNFISEILFNDKNYLFLHAVLKGLNASAEKFYFVSLSVVFLFTTIVLMFMFTPFIIVFREYIRNINKTKKQHELPEIIQTPPINKKDYVLALVVGVITLIFGLLIINNEHEWGDDFSCYINQGIAMAEGRFKEQTYINNFLVNGTLDEQKIYSGGISLVISLVYSLIGYDYSDFSNIVYYKIPFVVCFAVTAYLIYIFFRKHFSRKQTFVLSMLFVLCTEFLYFIQNILTDIPFMMLSMIAVLFVRSFFETSGALKAAGFGALIGAITSTMNLVRGNGIVLLIALLCYQLYLCFQTFILKRRNYGEERILKYLLWLIPYISYFAINALLSFVIPPASGMSLGFIFSSDAVSQYASHIYYYWDEFIDFAASVLPFGVHPSALRVVCLFLLFIGLVELFKHETFNIIYLIGSYALFVILPYNNQGLRYLYYVLPIAVLLAVYGFKFFYHLLLDMLDKETGKKVIFTFKAVVCVVLVLEVGNACYMSVHNQITDRAGNDSGAYSSEAKNLYEFAATTDPDAVFIFEHPRAFYLNTNRLCTNIFNYDKKEMYPERLLLADYYVVCTKDGNQTNHFSEIKKMSSAKFIPVYKDRGYVIYSVQLPEESEKT